jgi:hypothetical protein
MSAKFPPESRIGLDYAARTGWADGFFLPGQGTGIIRSHPTYVMLIERR